jgi:pyrroloquinoline-quinone synthase
MHFVNHGMDDLSEHLIAESMKSSPDHVMWLNREIGKESMNTADLSRKLQNFFKSDSVSSWIKTHFLSRFYGETPHRFVIAMQSPSRGMLAGYAYEHHFFLKQWVKSLAYIVAKTDAEEVQRSEIDNMLVEFFGYGGKPSHHELLIRMGEDLGLSRNSIINGTPLPRTMKSVQTWEMICRDNHWLEGMAAMHSLELVASRNLRQMGSRVHYFNEEILENNMFPASVVEFLREGYEADVGHSESSLLLVDRYCNGEELKQEVLASYLESEEAFYRYLDARYLRGKEFEAKL